MTLQQIEALKLALEALNANYLLVNGTETHNGLKQCLDGYYSSCFDTDPINKQTEEAITAIKEALAQPEQKPVAWIERDIQCDDFDPDSVTCEKPTIATDGWEWVGLYTIPPQRTWVGLTDEDMYVVSEEESCSFIAGAKWSEAILKEKNT